MQKTSFRSRSAVEPESVFLNLPFERDYENVFVAYLVGLTSLGLVPRCVLDLDENGDGRMARLFGLMSRCSSSIHDLSYQGTEFRYNMPFELGIAYALSRLQKKHCLVIFEAEKRELLKTLSDLRGFDPKHHGKNGEKALDMVYESFISPTLSEAEKRGRAVYEVFVSELAAFRFKKDTVFNRRSFQSLISVASERLKS